MQLSPLNLSGLIANARARDAGVPDGKRKSARELINWAALSVANDSTKTRKPRPKSAAKGKRPIPTRQHARYVPRSIQLTAKPLTVACGRTSMRRLATEWPMQWNKAGAGLKCLNCRRTFEFSRHQRRKEKKDDYRFTA